MRCQKQRRKRYGKADRRGIISIEVKLAILGNQPFAGALKQLGVAVLYASLLYIGEFYFESDAIVGYFEPASGLALAALLIGGKRYAWGVFIGALLNNTISGNYLWAAATIALGDALQALCGAWLLTREGKFDLLLQSLRDYLRLILLGGCVSITIGAVAVNTALLFSGLLASKDYFYSLIRWWMSDTLGVILIAPLIMAWYRARIDWRKAGRMAEAILLSGLTVLLGQIVFLDWLHDSIGQVAKSYWMFIAISWVAVRFGVRGTVVALSVVAIQALFGAIQGTGFFADDIEKTQLANYWCYMLVISVFGMALASHLTERKLAKAELRIAAVAFESHDGIMITDVNNTIMRVNDAFSEITGYTAEEAVGQTPRLLDSGCHDAIYYAAMWEDLQHTGSWRGEIQNRRKNGEVYPAQFTITAVKGIDGEINHYVAILHDITERKKAEEQISNLAFYDTLTQLPNRRMLNDRLGQAMAASKRSGRYAALMFLDLDNFKPLNDMHGHEAGDLLLIQAAHRIASCVREVDTVARFGGDEFVVILSELDTDKADSAVHAGIVAEKIRAILSKPYLLPCKQEGDVTITVEHHCTSSIGITLFIGHEANSEGILKQADMAMYQAKEGGRNQNLFAGAMGL
ncbi:MAG: diguanylate cyclase [Gallionella sp.]|nr:diguanylate cyclase [Gallionella sp.]